MDGNGCTDSGEIRHFLGGDKQQLRRRDLGPRMCTFTAQPWLCSACLKVLIGYQALRRKSRSFWLASKTYPESD